jgi:hypothetical protein
MLSARRGLVAGVAPQPPESGKRMSQDSKRHLGPPSGA